MAFKIFLWDQTAHDGPNRGCPLGSSDLRAPETAQSHENQQMWPSCWEPAKNIRRSSVGSVY